MGFRYPRKIACQNGEVKNPFLKFLSILISICLFIREVQRGKRAARGSKSIQVNLLVKLVKWKSSTLWWMLLLRDIPMMNVESIIWKSAERLAQWGRSPFGVVFKFLHSAKVIAVFIYIESLYHIKVGMGPPHVFWDVSFGFWVTWSISSWQEN